MIGKAKEPFSGFKGALGAHDRTIGRDRSLAVNFQDRRTGMNLSVKKVPNRSGSQARHDRAKVYCDCDIAYKAPGPTKQAFLKTHWLASRNHTSTKYTNYQIWMKYCLGSLPEASMFMEFSFFSRYYIINLSVNEWENEVIRLLGINNKRSDGKDVQVFKTAPTGEILESIPHHINEAGTADIKVSLEPLGGHMNIDVYSYDTSAWEEGW